MSGGWSDTLLSGVDLVTMRNLPPDLMGEGLQIEINISKDLPIVLWTKYLVVDGTPEVVAHRFDAPAIVETGWGLNLKPVWEYFDGRGNPLSEFEEMIAGQVKQFVEKVRNRQEVDEFMRSK